MKVHLYVYIDFLIMYDMISNQQLFELTLLAHLYNRNQADVLAEVIKLANAIIFPTHTYALIHVVTRFLMYSSTNFNLYSSIFVNIFKSTCHVMLCYLFTQQQIFDRYITTKHSMTTGLFFHLEKHDTYINDSQIFIA